MYETLVSHSWQCCCSCFAFVHAYLLCRTHSARHLCLRFNGVLNAADTSHPLSKRADTLVPIALLIRCVCGKCMRAGAVPQPAPRRRMQPRCNTRFVYAPANVAYIKVLTSSFGL